MSNDRPVFTDGWEQQQIVTPSVYEARLIVGAIPESNHFQAQYEIFVPTTKVLLAMKSWPHLRPEQFRLKVSDAHAQMMDKLYELGGNPAPFPEVPPSPQ